MQTSEEVKKLTGYNTDVSCGCMKHEQFHTSDNRNRVQSLLTVFTNASQRVPT